MLNPPSIQKTEAGANRQSFSLHLVVGNDGLPRFFQLLQRGFMIKVRKGSSLKTILCDRPGITPEYLEKRIQTLFIDGKAVDDVNHAIPNEGSTVALSAAMPGLVGATLRRGGFYAAMRSQITYQSGEERSLEGEIMIRMKLFNLLIQELGRGFLQKGLYLDCRVLEDFLKEQGEDFWKECRAIELDGGKLSGEALRSMSWPCGDKTVFLKVTPTGSEA